MVKVGRALAAIMVSVAVAIALSGCSRSFEDVAGERIASRVREAEDEFAIKMQAELHGEDFLSPPGIALVDLRELVDRDASLARGQPGMYSLEESSSTMTLGLIAYGEANSGGITNNDHKFFTCYEMVGTFGSPEIEKRDAVCPDWVRELVSVDATLLPFDQLSFEESS